MMESRKARTQPEKQPTMEMFYKKLVQDDTKSVDQGDIASGGHTKGDSKKENISKSKDNTTNSQTEQVARKRKLESHSGAGDTREDLHAGQAGACSIDTGQAKSTFVLLHKTGDLFSSPETDSLAHCVSRDLGMGKGIAVLFKKTFGGVQELKNQEKEVGDVAVLKRGHRFVYYLITKKKYWGKPTYDTLKDSLLSMKHHMLENGVRNLSMPRIGCGLDMLQWPKVELMLREIFADMELTVSIYTLASK